ncbi:hypothetical protein D9M71_535730 [compost metagenome]
MLVRSVARSLPHPKDARASKNPYFPPSIKQFLMFRTCATPLMRQSKTAPCSVDTFSGHNEFWMEGGGSFTTTNLQSSMDIAYRIMSLCQHLSPSLERRKAGSDRWIIDLRVWPRLARYDADSQLTRQRPPSPL